MPRTMSTTHDEQHPQSLHRQPHTVDVAEAAGFAFLRVVKSTGPIYGHIAFGSIETGCALHAATGANPAKFEETIKDRTVIADIVLALFLWVGLHVIRSHLPQEVDILIRMKLAHFEMACRFCTLRSVRWTPKDVCCRRILTTHTKEIVEKQIVSDHRKKIMRSFAKKDRLGSNFFFFWTGEHLRKFPCACIDHNS